MIPFLIMASWGRNSHTCKMASSYWIAVIRRGNIQTEKALINWCRRDETLWIYTVCTCRSIGRCEQYSTQVNNIGLICAWTSWNQIAFYVTSVHTHLNYFSSVLIHQNTWENINRLVQKRCNSSAYALELCFFCIKTSIKSSRSYIMT